MDIPALVSAGVIAIDDPMSLNAVEILWQDGKKLIMNAYNLRMNCPCAACEKTDGPRGIPKGIEIRDMAWVGNYAINFLFSDGHDTGIYTYKELYSWTVNA